MSIGLTVTNSDSRPKWFYWWLLHSRGLDWICKGQWPKAQVAEVSREAGVIPGWKITLLGFDIVFYLQLDFECWPKVITNIRSGCKFKLVSNVQTIAKFEWCQDISYCSGYRGSNCFPQDIWISGYSRSFLRNVWLFIRHEIVGYHISSSEQLSNPFHTYLEEEHIFRWLNAYAAAILKLYCLVFFPTLEIPIIISTTT